MSGRTRLALCAFAATVLASCALLPLVHPATWIVQAGFLVAVQSGVGALARRVPLARSLTIAAQALVTLLLLTAIFVGEQAVLGVLPGPDAVQAFGTLLSSGADDVGRYAIPAPVTDGIRLMLVGGVLLIGLLVDAIAVTFRSAAPAGLPLLALYSVAAGLTQGGASWLWFVLAAAGYLLLLLAEGRDRLSQWGRVFGGAARAPGRVAAGLESGGGAALAPVRTGRRIGAVALGIALVVPAALPALDGGLLDGTGGGPGSGSGGGTISAVNPLVSLQNSLNVPEDREVLKYRTNADRVQDQYIRIVALDQFDGTEWRTSTRRLTDVPEELPNPPGLNPSVATTEVTTSVSAAGWYGQTYLPMPYPASEVDIKGRWRFEPTGRTLVGDRGQSTRGVQYTVKNLVVRPTAQQLAGAIRPEPELQRQFTQVPSSLPAVVKSTALKVTQGAKDDYAKAVRLQDWFASDGGFTYNTKVRSGTGSTAIVDFLKQKEGFCVHFSFSMAAMARTLGIPARVSVGFTPGTPKSDGSMSVGLRDAHAWPELYFEGVGWTRFEPTPSRGSTPEYTRPETPSGQPSSPATDTPSESAAPSAAPSASSSCTPQLQRQLECGPDQAVGGGGPSDSGWTGLFLTLLWVVPLVLLALLIPLLPMLWRIQMRSRRLAGSDGRAPADAMARTLAAWQEVNDSAWDLGILPDEAQSPRMAAARIVRIGRLDTEAAEAVHRVAAAVEQVLYAPVPRPAMGLGEDVRRIRAGLWAGLGLGTRLRALLAPRSAARVLWVVSERWDGVAARMAEAGQRTERWAANLRRPLRQRG
ncbi:transglutaminase family protein [Streptomyces sp. SYSU K217416]